MSQEPPRPPSAGSAASRGLLRIDVVVFVSVSVGVALFTAYMMRRYREHDTAAWRDRISSVADSHAQLLSAWFQERAADAAVLAAHPSIAEGLAENSGSRTIPPHLDRVVAAYGYAAAYVHGPTGEDVASSSGAPALGTRGVEEVRRALAEGTALAWVAGDTLDQGQVGFVRPALGRSGSGDRVILGCVTLVMEAKTILPLLSPEAAPTRTGEVILAIPDPDDAGGMLFASVRTNAASPIQRVVRVERTLAARALEGQGSFGAFHDYRGHDVLAGLRTIPTTGWGIVYKVDRTEVLEEFRQTLALAVTMTAILIVALGGVLVAHRRHTEAARLRDRLEKLHLTSHLRLLLESTAEGIYGIDLAGRCTFINGAAARMVGREPADLLGRDLHELVHHSHLDGRPYPAAECPIFDTCRTSRGVRREGEVFWRRDGSCFPVEYSSFPVFEEGAPKGAVVTFSDITARRRLEEQLRQSQKMEALGRMAGGVAHDFNNLLTAILGYGDLILADSEATRKIRGRVDAILAGASRAAELTRQLLAFSRKQVLVPRLLDLNLVVQGVTTILERVIGEDVTLQVQLSADPLPVKADPVQIEQVLVNLVVNARDAMPRGGTILVTTSEAELGSDALPPGHADVRPGPYAVLTVRDSGRGIPPEVLAHVFEPFFTTKETGKGTGLGLATVYGVVSQSHGFVTVDSQPGDGATFRVHLPRSAEILESRVPRPATSEVRRGTETILLVEDEDSVRALAREILGGCGYQILEARHAGEALVIAERHPGPIHMLLTDVVMPHMSGVELAARLVPLRPETKVLFISGYTGDAIVEHGISEEDTAFLSKPFSPHDLAAKVREVLGPPES